MLAEGFTTENVLNLETTFHNKRGFFNSTSVKPVNEYLV